MGLLWYPGFATCKCIFYESMKEFIGVFYVFLEVQTSMVVEFYEIIYAMGEVQKMRITNVWLKM